MEPAVVEARVNELLEKGDFLPLTQGQCDECVTLPELAWNKALAWLTLIQREPSAMRCIPVALVSSPWFKNLWGTFLVHWLQWAEEEGLDVHWHKDDPLEEPLVECLCTNEVFTHADDYSMGSKADASEASEEYGSEDTEELQEDLQELFGMQSEADEDDDDTEDGDESQGTE
jgi:hypothetical protein